MKAIIALSFVILSSTAFAKTFIPQSGLKFTCYDLANQTYSLKVVDLGDQDAQVIVHDQGVVVGHYKAEYKEYSEGSYFVASNGSSELFEIVFPDNNIKAAYYQDAGDRRSLSCKALR